MNLKYIEKKLRKMLNEKLGLEFEYEYKNDYLDVNHTITYKDYEGDIYTSFTFYKDGLITICFVFGKMQASNITLNAINNFNKDSVWLTAYISKNGYLTLRNNIFTGSDNSAIENVDFILNHLISDKIIKILQPLTMLTVA